MAQFQDGNSLYTASMDQPRPPQNRNPQNTLRYSNYGQEVSNETARLPLDQRFNKLFQLFNRGDIRELQEIFPLAVEAIFGFQNPANKAKQQLPVSAGQWDGNRPYIPNSFCDITKADYWNVREAGFALLRSEGPVLKFLLASSISRSGASSPRYEFPVCCLPFVVQKNLENGTVSPWYRDKVLVDHFVASDIEGSEYISLSAFDFYFVHFAYHLVNPDLRTNNSAEPDCLYMVLVDDYSEEFFNARSVLENQRLPPVHNMPSIPRNLFQIPPRRGPLEESLVQNVDLRPQKHPMATSENLESLINIFVEFWLNMSGFSSQRYGRKSYHGTSSGDRARLSPTLGNSSLFSPGSSRRRQPALQNTPTVFPPVCALQAFRQIIKAIHEFIYATPVDGRGSQKNLEASLLDMKRHIIPQLIQRPLYDLLKTTVKKYPMDSSFRFVYELWLTYLQPWKYDNLEQNDRSGTEDIVVVSKEQRWNNFVSENLLFYGALYQSYLNRMLQMDFGVPFNTLAVFRVNKVFCETEMYKLVNNIEEVMLGLPRSGGKVEHPRSGFSPSKTAVRNHFADLEGPSFTYVPMLVSENIAKAVTLVNKLVVERRVCEQRLHEMHSSPMHDKMSLDYWKGVSVDAVKSLFGLVTGPFQGMRLQPAELERMSKHLAKAIEYLSIMFQVEESDILDSGSNQLPYPGHLSLMEENPLFGNLDGSRHNFRKAPLKTRPEQSRIEESSVPYLTEPEKRPPKSWEVEFLIPLLNELARHINRRYGDRIIHLYNGRDFFSRLVHPLIEPPHYPAHMSDEDSGRYALPARINLRPLASKYVLGSLLFAWFFIWIVDFGYFHGICWMLALPLFFLVANALLEPFREQ